MNTLISKISHITDNFKLSHNNNLLETPEEIFKILNNIKNIKENYTEILIKQQKILNKLHIEHYDFDNITKFDDKKSNHQELLYNVNKPINIVSLNNIYKGKLKIWFHKSVSDHDCLSETIPYKIIDVAVKIIEHSDAIDNENNEPEMLYYLQNEPEIIKLFGFHIDPIKQKCIIVMEWCEGGDLFNYAKSVSNSGISVKEIKYIIKWLINIILKCHKYDICHSDLKLDNIMLSIPNDITSLRLIDFGASKFIHDNGRDIIYKFLSTSIHYTPPEVIDKFHMKLNCKFLDNYNLYGNNLFKIDIWQIGIIAYTLLHGYFPFDSSCLDKKERNNKIFKRIELCKPPTYTKKIDKYGIKICDNNCIDFLNKLISFDPKKRIPLTEALEHPWLN
jgi:serine/threonine protein kinase